MPLVWSKYVVIIGRTVYGKRTQARRSCRMLTTKHYEAVGNSHLDVGKWLGELVSYPASQPTAQEHRKDAMQNAAPDVL